MASPEFEALLSQADRTQKALWAALTLSIVVYAVVAQVGVPVSAESSTAGALRPALWVAAAALAATSALLSRRRAAQPSLPHSGLLENRPSPLLRGSTQNLSAQERGALAEVASSFPTWIVCLVMNEAIAILGLVLAFVAGRPDEILPFAGLAILLNLVMRPDARRRAAQALGHVGL